MRSRVRSTASVLALLLVTSLSSLAAAQNVSDGDRKAARDLYEKGASLQVQGKPADALDSFMRSYTVFPAPTTALHVAAMNGDSDVAHVLLAHGAKVDLRTTAEETPLFMAARRGSPDTVLELLTAGADPNAINGELGYTPVHAAAYWGTPETLHVLLARGARRDDRTGAGETALHLAARAQDALHAVATCALLLDAGADPLARDLRGFTVAHTAASVDHLEVIQALKASGVDLSALAPDGANATDVAIRYESDRVAQYLFEIGVPPNLTPRVPPPLVVATTMGDALRVRHILAAATADPMGREIALHLAEEMHRLDLTSILQKR